MIQLSGADFGGLWADTTMGALYQDEAGTIAAGSGTLAGGVLAVDGGAFTYSYALRVDDPETGDQAFVFTGRAPKVGG